VSGYKLCLYINQIRYNSVLDIRHIQIFVIYRYSSYTDIIKLDINQVKIFVIYRYSSYTDIIKLDINQVKILIKLTY